MTFILTMLTTYLKSAGRRRLTYVLRALLAFAAFAVVLNYLMRHLHLTADLGFASHYYSIWLQEHGLQMTARFLILLMSAVTILTPAYFAPILSIERQKKTVETLLILPLGTFRIVVGKVMQRLPLILLIILGSTPLLFFCMMFGGVSSTQILAGLGAIVAGLLFCAAVSIFVSAISPRSSPIQTIIYSYLLIALLTFMHLLILWIIDSAHSVYAPPPRNWLADIVIYVNPFVFFLELFI